LLFLQNNNDLAIPKNVLGNTREDIFLHGKEKRNPNIILEYYFSQRRGQPLNEVKLILVGRGEVGKSSLALRLTQDIFDEKMDQTNGIQITKWQPPKKATAIKFNIWDFGGQEIMHSTHKFFLTERSVYVLVLDGRADLAASDANYWLDMISVYSANSPVIVVLNKFNLVPFQLNEASLKRNYPNIATFIKTDCKKPVLGFDDLKTQIFDIAASLPNVKDKFLPKWIQIKDALEQQNDSFVTLQKYRDICSSFGETDEAYQDQLRGVFHALGVFVNFQDDARLSDHHVLNPHWLTGGIYKILLSEVLKSNNGELKFSDISQVLNSSDYPSNTHGFLTEIMRKFELCFSIGEDVYLFPLLLEIPEPENIAAFDKGTALQLYWELKIVPPGFFPRFIVKSRDLSRDQPRWRSGVMLRFASARGIVRVEDKTITILVDGAVREDRVQLLDLVRSYLQEIASSIQNLEPLEKLKIPGSSQFLMPVKEILGTYELCGDNKNIPRFIDGTMENINLEELLYGETGFLPKPERQVRNLRSHRSVMDAAPIRVFYSYSHKDETLRDQLETHLTILKRRGLIQSWHDRRINPGQVWVGEIDSHLDSAQIILLLVSADFISSEYCYEIEMKRAMARHDAGEAVVIPIMLRACNKNGTPFSAVQGLPKDFKPVTSWDNTDEAWTDVSLGIERAINAFLQKP
jgi:internalin A